MFEQILKALGINKDDVQIYIKIGLNYARQIDEMHKMMKKHDEILEKLTKKEA